MLATFSSVSFGFVLGRVRISMNELVLISGVLILSC